MEGRAKAITAVVGLLTAIVVLMGSLTGQGWLPTFIKAPVQSAIPGTQPNENRQVPEPGSSKDPQPGPSNTGGGRQGSGNSNSKVGAYGPDTCVQGYVWREAVPDDHVCVTPETRDRTRADNAAASSRRLQQ